jgi:hypothetical protein
MNHVSWVFNVQEGTDAVLEKLRKRGINVSPEQEQAFISAVEAGDFGAAAADLEETAESDVLAEGDKLLALCGSAVCKK